MIKTEQQFLSRFTYHYQNDVLGGGAFGKVYKAYDNTLGRFFAVKIADHVTHGDKTFSLADEFNALDQLPDHINIAKYEQLYTFETHRGKVDYALMQYYPEGNLSQLIQKGNLTQVQREDMATQLLQGIAFLHQHQVVHRDLKPSNILVQQHAITQVYIPKITDFGLSKKANTDKNTHFTNSFAAGTYAYSSPEQLKGETLRFNTDLWAYGAIVYEIFTGKTMFNIDKQGTGSSAMDLKAILDLIMSSDISTQIAELPTQWQNVVKACLVRDTQQRVKTAQDLQNILAGKTSFDYQEPVTLSKNDETIILQSPLNTNNETVLEPKVASSDNSKSKQSNDYTISSPVKEPAKDKKSNLLWFVGIGVVFIILVFIFVQRGERQSTNEESTQISSETNDYGAKSPPLSTESTQISSETNDYGLEVKNLKGVKMIKIPGKDYYMGETEVTIGQYLNFCKAVGKHYPQWLEEGSKYNIYTGRDDFYKKAGMSESNTNHPITGVSRYDAEAFAEWLGGRLPTESEWEHAAKGGQNYKYAGSNNINEVAWYNDNSGSKIHPVKGKKPNGYGLYDISGNVWEWTAIASGSSRVLRGGSWNDFAESCSVANRIGNDPSYRYYSDGFRVLSL
jgi:serine/threonine protein kinase